ncbi:MAG TPA: hypothetical protein VNE41_12100 [Chitinophagaceae bacterium]|nr:hypothetical protein [Chitinophagaceae bacterium]
MRFLVLLVLNLFLCWLAGLFLPFWTVAAVPFIIFLLIPQRPAIGFICAFLSIFLLWFILAIVMDMQNNHILSDRMSMLIFNHRGHILILVVASLTGALPAGFAGLTACLLRHGTKKKTIDFGRFYSKYF